MPRKTNGIEIELYPGPQKDREGKTLLYARPASRHKISTRDVDDFCAEYRHMQAGEMSQFFETFLQTAGMWLAKGYRVETPIGSFSLKLKLMGEHTDPHRVTSQDIRFGGVEFTPSRRFLEAADQNKEGYRWEKAVVGNSQMYDATAMEEALQKSLKPGYTTVRRFMFDSGLKRDSAQKYLDSLCVGDNARLRRRKDGRTFIYSPRKDEDRLSAESR